jgi:hypothetical protein
MTVLSLSSRLYIFNVRDVRDVCVVFKGFVVVLSVTFVVCVFSLMAATRDDLCEVDDIESCAAKACKVTNTDLVHFSTVQPKRNGFHF